MFDIAIVKGPSPAEVAALGRERESLRELQAVVAELRASLEARRALLSRVSQPPCPADDQSDYCFDAGPTPEGLGPAIGANFFES
jgi:hypothetical protein